jgi:hypothetical protein
LLIYVLYSSEAKKIEFRLKTGNQWSDDLQEKQDTGTTALKNTAPVTSNVSPAWNATGNHGLLVIGLKPGYSVVINNISGKQLYRATASSEKAFIDISKMKTACTIFIVTDR